MKKNNGNKTKEKLIKKNTTMNSSPTVRTENSENANTNNITNPNNNKYPTEFKKLFEFLGII